MLFTSPSSSLLLLLLLLVLVASSASNTVSARPLPSSAYKITPFSSVQLVGRQDGLIDLLGLEGDSNAAAAAAGEEEGGTTTSVAVVKGGSTTTTTVGKETSAAATVQVATRESTTTTPTTKAPTPTTLTTAKQAQTTTTQPVVVVVGGTQTAATASVVVATPSSAAAAAAASLLSSSPAVLSPASTSTAPSSLSLDEDPLPSSLAVASSSIFFTRSSSASLPSASSNSTSPPTTANLSTTPSPSPFSPQSSLFPLLLTGLILGSLLTLGLLFLVLKRVVIPSSKKSKRWGGKGEGEDVLPWNELGSEGRMVESGMGLGGTRIGETSSSESRYPSPVSYGQQQQAPRGIASSETEFGIGSHQYQSSAGFDRDPRGLPNYGGEVVGWPGDVAINDGAMENRTRGGGVGMPPPVYEEGRVAIGERGRSEKRGGGAGGR